MFDRSVERELSMKRAHGLKRLGKIFQNAKSASGKSDVRSLMEAAMLRAMGVDVNNPGGEASAEDSPEQST